MSNQSPSRRTSEALHEDSAWRKWGPYLSERQWGTVREDLSQDGNAWDSFSHDQARSRAYHWGEDGLAGLSDDHQRLCFALALWNGKDPILKERLFGLTNSEGNHGEDVKEYYFYLDSTPTHSYMKYLYKYPQAGYPYEDLVKTNRSRGRTELEYELLDTGIFDTDRYFDVFVEYAKADPDEILIRITVHNRGPDEARIDLLPTLWFRNTWWSDAGTSRPRLHEIPNSGAIKVIQATHPELGERFLYCAGARELLFTENETNNERLFKTPNSTPYVKDGINSYIVHGESGAVNPLKQGTKAAAHYQLRCPPGRSASIRLRLSCASPDELEATSMSKRLFEGPFDEVVSQRKSDADEFYQSITPPGVSEDAASVMRQALAGMLWSKQYYCYPVANWLRGRGMTAGSPGDGKCGRNQDWHHMINEDIISMPDKWEYPWYAAWDLAFHSTALSLVDLPFARDQLNLMLEHRYLHPNGQLPAYEWNFSDVNPPVHAFAAMFNYLAEEACEGRGDTLFLRRTFNNLMLKFAWWINRKDVNGRNVFEGGFLGLDNISVFDRSAPLPTGGHLEQADGTAWMAFYSATMFHIALELAKHDPLYEEMALKFLQHFLSISVAMNNMGGTRRSMWDQEDGFFYDVLRLPSGEGIPLKVRSIVGLLPMCANAVFEADIVERYPKLIANLERFLAEHPEMQAQLPELDHQGVHGRYQLSILTEDQFRRSLARMLDENEFFSDYGIRALSRWHADHPYIFHVNGQEQRVDYLPAESNSGLFGGNSNWRGPIWFPINILIVRTLLLRYLYCGNDFRVECPTGSGKLMNLFEVAREIAHRLTRIFLRDDSGRRPVHGGTRKFQKDPYWKDHLLFYEYFHGDNGAGLGASHQTGWTGLVANLIHLFGRLTPDEFLRSGGRAVHSGAYTPATDATENAVCDGTP